MEKKEVVALHDSVLVSNRTMSDGFRSLKTVKRVQVSSKLAKFGSFWPKNQRPRYSAVLPPLNVGSK